jgi:hypothetical protein
MSLLPPNLLTTPNGAAVLAHAALSNGEHAYLLGEVAPFRWRDFALPAKPAQARFEDLLDTMPEWPKRMRATLHTEVGADGLRSVIDVPVFPPGVLDRIGSTTQVKLFEFEPEVPHS